jgi:hypothetical protein
MIRHGEIGGRDQCDPKLGHRSARFEFQDARFKVGMNGIKYRVLFGFKSQK